MVRVARVYDAVQAADGTRVLVDRLWPRGIRKDDPRIDIWCKEVAPSRELRSWYGHQQERFAEFRKRYLAELDDPAHRAAMAQLRKLASSGTVTLLTASKAVEISDATVLAAELSR